MSGEQKLGLYKKYRVERTDGSSAPGGKHEFCQHYVLDLVHDPFAKPAILAYAKACEKTHPVLAQDLREMALHFTFSGGRTGITPRCIGPSSNGKGRCSRLYKKQAKGWKFVSIRPIEGWLCPGCRPKLEAELWMPSPKPFASTKSKDGAFPI
jgi:hypothetical protein